MINKLRKEIERTDGHILRLLNSRLAVVRKLKKEKNKTGLPFKDRLREHELFQSWQNNAKRLSLDKLFILKFFRLLTKESRRIQNEK